MVGARSALVTGAGSGVGQATAVLLAEAGYRVLLVGRTAAKLEATATEARRRAAAGAAITTFAGDLCDPNTCREAVAAAVERFGRLDAIANVAGHAQICPIERITPEEWRRTIDTNVSAVMYLTSAAWPVFRRQNSGVLVNVSSMASIDPFPGFALYAPSKAALNMFTHIAAREGAAIGVKAVTIAPGAIETPMLRAVFDEKVIPRDKTLSPETVAAVIRDCITGARAFQSGEVIRMPSPA